MIRRLSRREFLGTSAKAGLGVVGLSVLGAACTSPATKGPVTLEFWQIAQGAPFDVVMKKAIEAFKEKQPSINVRLNVEPYYDTDTKVRTVFNSGGPGPDIVMTGSVASLTYAKMPYGFIDIADRVKAAGIKDKIPSAMWVTMEEKGKVFGVPWCAFPFLLTYNKDLYEAAGIKQPPETEDELMQVSKKLQDASKDRFGFLAATNFPAWILEQLWYNNGLGYFEGSEDFLSYDITKPITMTKPQSVALLEYVGKLAETAPGGLKGNIGVQSPETVFSRGNVGALYTLTIGSSQIPNFNPKMVPQKNWDIALFPRGSKRKGMMFSTNVFGIAKGSKDPDAAWEFVKFLSNEWEGRLAPTIGTVPARKDVQVDETNPASWLIPVGRKLLAGEIFPQAFFPQVTYFATALKPNVEAFYSGSKSAKQALEDTATEAKKSF